MVWGGSGVSLGWVWGGLGGDVAQVCRVGLG